MKPDYKNWIPRGMLFSLIAGTVLSLALLLVFGVFGICVSGKLRIVLSVVFGIAFVVCAKYTEWCVNAYPSAIAQCIPVTNQMMQRIAPRMAAAQRFRTLAIISRYTGPQSRALPTGI